MLVLYAALGGAIGAALRHLINESMSGWLGKSFPYSTLTINIVGSICMGVVLGYLLKVVPDNSEVRALVVVGVLGGFTTFSTFSWDAVQLIERGHYSAFFIYIISSVVLSIGGLYLGLYGIRQVV